MHVGTSGHPEIQNDNLKCTVDIPAPSMPQAERTGYVMNGRAEMTAVLEGYKRRAGSFSYRMTNVAADEMFASTRQLCSTEIAWWSSTGAGLYS